VVVSPTGEGIGIDTVIIVEFSEPMNLSSVTIVVSNSVEGDVVFDGDTATCTLHALECNRRYTVTVSGKDLAGNVVERSWSFTTMKNEGSITGLVTDGDGRPIDNATVTLNNGATTTTDQDGHYTFTNVTVGNYTFEIVKDGFTTLNGTVAVTLGLTNDTGSVIIHINPSAARTSDWWGVVALIVVLVALLFIILLLFRRRKDNDEEDEEKKK
jgi:hypothetical protein